MRLAPSLLEHLCKCAFHLTAACVLGLQVMDGMLLQLPTAAQQAAANVAASPSSRVTTPQHSASQATQLLVMQGIGSGAANATSIPVGSVLMTAAPVQVHCPSSSVLALAGTCGRAFSLCWCVKKCSRFAACRIVRCNLVLLQGQQLFVAQPQAGLVAEPQQQQQHIVTHMVSLPIASMPTLHQQQPPAASMQQVLCPTIGSPQPATLSNSTQSRGLHVEALNSACLSAQSAMHTSAVSPHGSGLMHSVAHARSQSAVELQNTVAEAQSLTAQAAEAQNWVQQVAQVDRPHLLSVSDMVQSSCRQQLRMTSVQVRHIVPGAAGPRTRGGACARTGVCGAAPRDGGAVERRAAAGAQPRIADGHRAVDAAQQPQQPPWTSAVAASGAWRCQFVNPLLILGLYVHDMWRKRTNNSCL